MIQFVDKKTEIPTGRPDGSNMKYSDIIKVCLGSAPQTGMTIAQMRERMKIMDKFDKKSDKVQLEDMEVAVIKNAISAFPFPTSHKHLLEMEDYINSLK